MYVHTHKQTDRASGKRERRVKAREASRQTENVFSWLPAQTTLQVRSLDVKRFITQLKIFMLYNKDIHDVLWAVGGSDNSIHKIFMR